MALETYVYQALQGARVASEGTALMLEIAGGDPLLMSVFRLGVHTGLRAVAEVFGVDSECDTEMLACEVIAELGKGE
jgi:hypothetical protein